MMITLSLLKFLEENGFGTIDENLFFQKLELRKTGVYITDIGSTQERGKRNRVDYEMYSRGSSDIDGYKRLDAIRRFLTNSYDTCVLPAVEPISTEEISNVTIMPTSTINSVGVDENNRAIYSFRGTIYY